jgi:hypothetical protein
VKLQSNGVNQTSRVITHTLTGGRRYTRNPTLSNVRGETGDEGREGSRRV